MGQLACELCGSTNLVKQDGVFVCQACGAKYSVEEARRMMNTEPARPATSARVEEIKARARETAAKAKAQAQQAVQANLADLLGIQDARLMNNTACQEFQKMLDAYDKVEHPSEADQKSFISDAKDVLAALQAAALVNPDDHLANLLIYKNADEVVEAVRDTRYWEQNEEGEWEKHAFGPSSSELKIAGQKDSWEDLARSHQDYVEMTWLEEHEDRMAERRELAAQAEQLEAQLAELKDEKRGLGIGANIPLISNLVNPEAKEMNERMKPVREELSGIRSKIDAIDDEKEDWVDDQLDALSKSFIRLSF